MKILIQTFHSPYTDESIGGAETSLRLIAEELTKLNHQVTFISRSDIKSWLGFRTKKVNGVNVMIFMKFKIKWLNAYRLKKVGSFFKNMYLENQLKHTQIVHTYNNISIVEYYVKLKYKFNYKLVVRMAGLKLFEDFETKPHLISMHEKNFKYIDLYNFISNGLRDLVLQKSLQFDLNVNFEPYFVKDIGIDLDQLPLKKIGNTQLPKTFKIVMASRLSIHQKRQDILIEAMTYLRNYNVQLTILGNGPNNPKLKCLAEKYNISNQIIFKPFEKKVWNSLINYDLLVHACDYEGLSKIIIESMGVGLPVLASRVLPLMDYIVEEKNGFLVENCPKKWAEKIIFILDNQKLLGEISRNSRLFVRKEYSSASNISVYEDTFKQLLISSNDEDNKLQ